MKHAANLLPENVQSLTHTLTSMQGFLDALKQAAWQGPPEAESLCNCGVIHPERRYVPTRYPISTLAQQAIDHSDECRLRAQLSENRQRREAEHAAMHVIEAGTFAFQHLLLYLQTPRPEHAQAGRAVLDEAILEVATALKYVRYCNNPNVVRILRSLQGTLLRIRKVPGA